MFQKTILVSAISLAMLSGCGDNSGVLVTTEDNNQNNGEFTGGNTDLPNNVDVRSLEPLETNEAFFNVLRQGLISQNPNQGGVYVDFDLAATSDAFPIAVAESADTSDAVSAADSVSTGSDGGADSNQVLDVTTTNVQEVGVDEQDRMKSDGEYLYVLDNQFDSYGGDFVDPAATSIAFPIEQNTTPKLRILQLQNDAPDVQLINEVEYDLNGGSGDGMYLHKAAGQTNLVITDTSFNSYLSDWYSPFAFNNATSVVGKMNVTDPNQATMETVLTIDGTIVSSRRIGDNLFLATRYYPAIDGIDPFSMSQEEYEVAIQNADLTDALPKVTNQTTSQTTELVDPSTCFVTDQAQQQADALANVADDSTYFYTPSPDLITLTVIDINSMEVRDSECFLGSSETLYATPNSIYLATTQWGYTNQPILALEETVDSSFVDQRTHTDIHQFSIDGSELTYSGSGAVSGHLGWNSDRMPFRMSEQGDNLRVATFAPIQNGDESPINVSVLNVAGSGDLATAAVLPNANRPEHIGKPGEQLYASRFLGDKGYLVTFRQTDPLYVVDFSNPSDPFLAGELEIEGYSDYLQPIGEDFLLGIGRDAVASGDNFGGAIVQGVKLSLFNVADPTNPTEVQSMVIGERGTNSPALFNHRAITVQSATDSHPTRVAFGMHVYGQADPAPIQDPWAYHVWSYSGLHGFDINVGDNAGIEQRGVLAPETASGPNDFQRSFSTDDRSVIVGDSTYYIYGSDVYAANWNDLGNFVGPR